MGDARTRPPPTSVDDLPELLRLAEAVCSKARDEVSIALLAAACGVSDRTWRAWASGESAPRGSSAELAMEIVHGFIGYRERFRAEPRIWNRDLPSWRKRPTLLTLDALQQAQAERFAHELATGRKVIA